MANCIRTPQSCRPVFALRIAVEAPSVSSQDALNLVRLTQHALDDLNDFSGHHLRLQLRPDASDASAAPDQDTSSAPPALTIRLAAGETMKAALDPHDAVLDVSYPPNSLPSHASSSSNLASFIASELRTTFAEEQAIISRLLSASNLSPSADTRAQNGAAGDLGEPLAKRSTRSLKYSRTYHLTFSLFTSGSTPNTWDVETAVAEYIKPVIDILSPIHNFTIDTQVQLYATPGVQSPVLAKDDLASFINAAEWPLSPSIGGAPTINFVIYIGNQTISLGENERSHSWLIPQWGTVYLLPLTDGAAHIDAATLKEPMFTFAGHLLSLLGTPQSGSLPLRLSTLARVRSADLLLRASSTLGSLARLSLALPSISIPPSVADGVAKTMEQLQLACATLGEPQGLEHARIAEEEAERAFFEKSMVGQLYFPDEHKIAVYLPLLGPVGVLMFMGPINELKAWRKRRREAAEAKAKAKANKSE